MKYYLTHIALLMLAASTVMLGVQVILTRHALIRQNQQIERLKADITRLTANQNGVGG